MYVVMSVTADNGVMGVTADNDGVTVDMKLWA